MKRLQILALLLVAASAAWAQRTQIQFNNDWQFRFSHQVQKDTRRVDLPHTWNLEDALSGKTDYKRGIGNYEKVLFVPPLWEGKRLFLRFEGVNSVANVFINGKHIGEHRGGYAAFVFEITDRVNYGKNNTILVRANNAEQLDVMPLVGDFNFYGGIYRDVNLLMTNPTCISPLDYASSGVYLVQESVSQKEARISVKVNLSNAAADTDVELNVQVIDGQKLIGRESRKLRLQGNTHTQEEIPLVIKNPHLWDGCADPFLYQVQVSLQQDGRMIDNVSQPLGLRSFYTDPDKGFFLNGKHLSLRGVCRHQDRAEVGNALRPQHHEEDVAIMREMGINAARLAHYPQATYMYDLMDKSGIVTWAEIPFIGPGGYADKGFVDQPSFRENGKTQLIELIRQNYNHPSICFWGLFNELKEVGDNPVEYIKELNVLAKQEDPTRIITSASNQGGDLNFITENIAWNRYDGWYGSTPKTLASFLDQTHQKHPQLRIGISEYGAGASIYHQQDSLTQTNPTSWWHPENWQTYYHIENWKIIHERPFVWGTFVWNMFDFGAAHRTEGDRPGINDKGLVTFDRKVKKDAFYFYKANWNKQEPMIYLAEKRCVLRTQPEQTFMAFTTAPEAELFVNGKSYGKQQTDNYATATWKGIKLQEGANAIRVTTPGKKPLNDEVVITYVP